MLAIGTDSSLNDLRVYEPFECPVVAYSVQFRNTLYISHCACRAALVCLPSAEYFRT